MTREELVQEAREVMSGVTEGPWQTGLVGAVVNWNLPPDHPNAVICQDATDADAEFIAAARQLVPAMADRIEADGKLIAELETEVAALSRMVTQLDETLANLEDKQ